MVLVASGNQWQGNLVLVLSELMFCHWQAL